MLGKTFRPLARVSITCLIIMILAGYYFLFTTVGSIFLARLILSKYIDINKVTISHIEGTFSKGLKLTDISINDIAWLPRGSSLKIQRLELSLRPFKFDSINLDIENCRLIMPYSEPIVLFASYKKVNLDVNVYSKRVDAEDILKIFSKDKRLKDLSGAITNIDSYVKGSFTKPQLRGAFEVERLSYKDLTFTNCPGSFAINVKKINKQPAMQGALIFQSGSLAVKDVNINLKESRILFSPDYKEPVFEFQGNANIDNIQILISLRGTVSNPYLYLTTDPQQPQNVLLFIVLTGRKLQENHQVREQMMNLDPGLTKAVLDYFLSGTDKLKISQALGISETPKESQPEKTFPIQNAAPVSSGQ
ncbi:MAG: translocation/assembly module TamB domain-containing protein [Candidatus Omnitrophota bacterium]